MDHNAYNDLETAFFLLCVAGVPSLTAGIGIALLARRLTRSGWQKYLLVISAVSVLLFASPSVVPNILRSIAPAPAYSGGGLDLTGMLIVFGGCFGSLITVMTGLAFWAFGMWFAARRARSVYPDSLARSATSREYQRTVAVLAASAVVICVGLTVHFTVYGPVGDFLADALYAVLAYLALSFVAPRVRSHVIAALSFLVCAAIEVSQLSGAPAALAEVFPPAGLILGTTFAPLDFVAYALGVGAAMTCDLLIQRGPPRASTGAWVSSSGDAEAR